MLCALTGAHVASAQLPQPTVPSGALRIEFTGGFYPATDVWSNGSRQPLGSLIDGPSNAFVGRLQVELTQVLGQPVSGLSIGGVTALASRERGVGDIGLAWGLSSRITIFGTVPVVFVRSRVTTSIDPSGAVLGLNPANVIAGDAAGQAQTSSFFAQFDAVLTDLGGRIQSGEYDNDPATLALAQQTLSRANTMRASLFKLLDDPNRSSALLPTRADPLGVQLLSLISTLQSTFANQLGISGFASTPALPGSALTSDQLAALIKAPTGFGLSSPNNLPRYGLGDLRAGVAVQLMEHGTVGSAAWRAIWVQATARFPTGGVADPSILLDQATGDKHRAGQLDVIAEMGHRRLGIRAEASYLHALSANGLVRLAAPGQLLVPASFLAAIRSQPGDSMAFAVRPFLAFAPHLAVTAVVQYWSRGASTSQYLAGQAPIAGADPASLDIGSSANAVVVGFGLAYRHDGTDRDGNAGLPVEAGWSIERTVASGHGLFPNALTSRVTLRLYRPLTKH